MDSEDKSGNVYALFPGIDTTPFGKTPEAGDEGWSALPEPTITTDDEPRQSGSGDSGVARRAPRGGIGRIAAVASLAAAVIAGAGFAAAQGLLSHPTRKSPTVSASRGSRPSPRHATTTRLRSAPSAWPRSRGHLHRRRKVKKKTPASRSPATVASTPAAPPTTPATPVAASSVTSASESSSAASASSTHGVHHSGPTGRVSLIGAGTTPSG